MHIHSDYKHFILSNPAPCVNSPGPDFFVFSDIFLSGSDPGGARRPPFDWKRNRGIIVGENKRKEEAHAQLCEQLRI